MGLEQYHHRKEKGNIPFANAYDAIAQPAQITVRLLARAPHLLMMRLASTLMTHRRGRRKLMYGHLGVRLDIL